jgi:hypothetical protein
VALTRSPAIDSAAIKKRMIILPCVVSKARENLARRPHPMAAL